MKQTLRQINIIILSLFILTFLSCRDKPDDEVVIIVSIDDEFEIDLWENLAVDVSSLYLKIETINTVDCENTKIDFEDDRNSINHIAITLNGIIPPDTCIEATVPAMSYVNIGYLAQREYSFDINLEGMTVTNAGTLTVSEESYVLKMNTNNGFKLLHGKLMRVPYQTIWGTVNYQNFPQTVNDVDEFLRDIKEISEEKEYKEGYYGYFSINDSGEIMTDDVTDFPNSKPFIFSYKNNIDDLQTLINNCREEHGEHVEIKLFTWEGKEL